MTKAKFDVGIIPGKNLIVTLAIAGEVGQDELPELKKWADSAKGRIREAFNSTNKKLAVLVDFTSLENFSEGEVLSIIADLMSADSKYVYKTATFGANKNISLAEEIAKSLSGRDNMKNFDTKEKALDWLNVREK